MKKQKNTREYMKQRFLMEPAHTVHPSLFVKNTFLSAPTKVPLLRIMLISMPAIFCKAAPGKFQDGKRTPFSPLKNVSSLPISRTTVSIFRLRSTWEKDFFHTIFLCIRS